MLRDSNNINNNDNKQHENVETKTVQQIVLKPAQKVKMKKEERNAYCGQIKESNYKFSAGIEKIEIKLFAQYIHERSRAAHTHNKIKHSAHTGGDWV